MPTATDEANFASIVSGDSFELWFAVSIAISPPVRLWNGLGERTIDGNLYMGAGSLLGISEVDETAQIESKSVQLSLSGMPPTMVSLALGSQFEGKRVEVLMGASNGQTSGVTKLFVGRADIMAIDDDGSSVQVTMTVESEMVKLERPSVARYTDEWQRQRYANDRGFQYVPKLQRAKIHWGKPGTGSVKEVTG